MHGLLLGWGAALLPRRPFWGQIFFCSLLIEGVFWQFSPQSDHLFYAHFVSLTNLRLKLLSEFLLPQFFVISRITSKHDRGLGHLFGIVTHDVVLVEEVT